MLSVGFDTRRTPQPNGKGLGLAGAFLTSGDGDELACLDYFHQVEQGNQRVIGGSHRQ